MSSVRRFTDLMIEIAVAVTLVTLYVVYLFQRRPGTPLPWELISVVVNTLIVFGFLVSWFRKCWRSYLFWIIVVVLFLIHLLVLSSFMRSRSLPTGVYALLINPIELLIFGKILKKLSPLSPTRS